MSPLCGSVCLFLRGGGGQPPPLFASSSGAGRAPPVPALPRAPPGSSSPPHPQRSGVPCPPPPHPGRWAPQSLHGAEGPPPGSRAPPLPPHIYLTPQLSVCSAQVCWGGGRGGLHPLTPHPPPGRIPAAFPRPLPPPRGHSPPPRSWQGKTFHPRPMGARLVGPPPRRDGRRPIGRRGEPCVRLAWTLIGYAARDVAGARFRLPESGVGGVLKGQRRRKGQRAAPAGQGRAGGWGGGQLRVGTDGHTDTPTA